MRFPRSAVVSLIALIALPAFAQVTLDRPFDEPVPYYVDSGLLPNPTVSAQVLDQELVRIEGAAWLRVYFGDVELGNGSYLRITSDLDGEVQELDAEALATWSHSTAYFNGDTVRVELVGGPETQRNRLVIDRIAWETEVAVPTGSCGICGPDDRVLSAEDFAARLLPAGCSAMIYNSQSCAVSAGHCIGGGMVLQFRVPLSNSNCNVNHPPVSEQFPVQQFAFTNGGVGNDWSVLVMGTNNLGEKPFDRYGTYMPIATTPPASGQSLTIWGYGVDSQCTRSQVQQTSGGQVTSVGSTHLQHSVDATYGNSGSSLVRDGQEILGIATHCPCPNWGTRIDHPSFAAARNTLCSETIPETAELISVIVTAGTPGAGGLPELGQSDDQYLVVESVPSGIRNNAIIEVVAQSPSASIFDLSVRVEYGPADVSPVFWIVQIFNWDTSSYNRLGFGVASTSTDSVLNVETIPQPNAYVDAAGQIKLRLIETARAVQTPDGYTKLVDQVLVTVVP